MRARNAAWPRRADQEQLLDVKGLWSALQTHLQGVNRAALATMPERFRHCAALLSRLSGVNVTRLAKQGKPGLCRPESEALASQGFVELIRASG
jgi:hypothetical protein